MQGAGHHRTQTERTESQSLSGTQKQRRMILKDSNTAEDEAEARK